MHNRTHQLQVHILIHSVPFSFHTCVFVHACVGIFSNTGTSQNERLSVSLSSTRPSHAPQMQFVCVCVWHIRVVTGTSAQGMGCSVKLWQLLKLTTEHSEFCLFCVYADPAVWHVGCEALHRPGLDSPQSQNCQVSVLACKATLLPASWIKLTCLRLSVLWGK